MKKHRIGIIGIGKMGNLHAKNVQKNEKTELIGFYDINDEHLKNALDEYNGTKLLSFNNIYELEKEVDSLIISTPTSTHFDILSYLSNSNINILCEKSITDNYFKYLELRKIFYNKTSILNVGQIERFNPIVNSFKEINENGTSFIKFVRKSNSERNRDVSCVFDIAIHDTDLLFYFFPYLDTEFEIKIINCSVNKSGYLESSYVEVYFNNFNFTADFSTSKNSRHISRNIVSENGICDLKNNYLLSSKKDENIIKVVDNYNDSISKKDNLTIQLEAFINEIGIKSSKSVSLNSVEKSMYLAQKIEDACFNNIN